MNRLAFSVCLFFALIWNVSIKAEEVVVVDSLFLAVPDSLLPLLSYNERMDLLDYYNCGQDAKSSNAYDGITYMKQKGEGTIVLQLTKKHIWQFCYLKDKKNKKAAYAIIKSQDVGDKKYCSVNFYSTTWKPLKAKWIIGKQQSLRDVNDIIWNSKQRLMNLVDKKDKLSFAVKKICARSVVMEEKEFK